jgi:hypothetical protein
MPWSFGQSERTINLFNLKEKEPHIPKTVLGKHIEGGGYIKKAQDTGSSYFDIGNKWDKLSPKQRWNA